MTGVVQKWILDQLASGDWLSASVLGTDYSTIRAIRALLIYGTVEERVLDNQQHIRLRPPCPPPPAA
jgi:hypothetical protein